MGLRWIPVEENYLQAIRLLQKQQAKPLLCLPDTLAPTVATVVELVCDEAKKWLQQQYMRNQAKYDALEQKKQQTDDIDWDAYYDDQLERLAEVLEIQKQELAASEDGRLQQEVETLLTDFTILDAAQSETIKTRLFLQQEVGIDGVLLELCAD